MTETGAAVAAFRQLRCAFREKGYVGRVGFGAHPAMLVVDLINGFTDRRSPLTGQLDGVLQATSALLSGARATGIPIYSSTIEYQPDLRDAGLWIRKIPSLDWLIAGNEWVQVDHRLYRRTEEVTISRKVASCVFGTGLMMRLSDEHAIRCSSRAAPRAATYVRAQWTHVRTTYTRSSSKRPWATGPSCRISRACATLAPSTPTSCRLQKYWRTCAAWLQAVEWRGRPVPL